MATTSLSQTSPESASFGNREVGRKTGHHGPPRCDRKPQLIIAITNVSFDFRFQRRKCRSGGPVIGDFDLGGARDRYPTSYPLCKMKTSEVENYLRFRASNHRPGFLSSDSDFYLRCSRNQEGRKWPPQISGLPYILPYIQSDQSQARFHAKKKLRLPSVLQHWPCPAVRAPCGPCVLDGHARRVE